MYCPRIIFGMPNKGYKNTYKNTAIQLQPLTALVINHKPLFVNLLDLLVQHRVADTQLNFHFATDHLSSVHNLKSRERLIMVHLAIIEYPHHSSRGSRTRSPAAAALH